MIHCYPTINGKPTRKNFKTEWGEVHLGELMKWQALADKIQPLEKKIEKWSDDIAAQTKVLEQAILNNEISRKAIAKKKISGYAKKQKLALKQLDDLYAEGIANFTNIPMDVLMNMDRAKEYEDNLVGLTDDHFELYKLRLVLMAKCPMPTEQSGSFHWQTMTDVELDELRAKYKKLSWMGKRMKKGRELSEKIKKGWRSKYTIRDIWTQTTIANQKFREFADVIVDQLQKDDFSNLANLVAILTVEGNADSEALAKIAKETSAQNYVEKYNEEFKKLYERRVSLFMDQRQKMNVAQLLMCVNFFLRK